MIVLNLIVHAKNLAKARKIVRFVRKNKAVLVYTGAIIGDGDRSVSLPIRVDPWYGTIFLFLEQIAPSWRHGSTHVSWALAWMLSRCVIYWWELRDTLIDFSQRWQGIRQRRRTRALLCTLMLWCNGKGVFFSVENFFNFTLLMNIIRSPDSLYTRKLSCLFCRRIIVL